VPERSIPFGFNIESVAIRKEEIEASIYIVNKIAEMLDKNGIRKHEGYISITFLTSISKRLNS
jgi:hypothetical protein